MRTISRFFVGLFFSSVGRLIDFTQFIAIAITAVLTFIILLLCQKSASDSQFLYLSRDAWLSVAGSMFAAALFLTIQATIAPLRRAKNHTYREFFNKTAKSGGLKEIFAQRGSAEAAAKYKRAISKAQRRIIALGMTNSNFVRDHADLIAERVRSRSFNRGRDFLGPQVQS